MGVIQYITSVTYDAGSYKDGTLANTQTDDANYYRSNKPAYATFDMNLFFTPALAGNDVLLSINQLDGGGVDVELWINGSKVAQGVSLNFDNQFYAAVNTIEIKKAYSTRARVMVLYYFKLDVDAPTNWGHKHSGVSGANIGKVAGVPIANIASIKGVDI